MTDRTRRLRHMQCRHLLRGSSRGGRGGRRARGRVHPTPDINNELVAETVRPRGPVTSDARRLVELNHHAQRTIGAAAGANARDEPHRGGQAHTPCDTGALQIDDHAIGRAECEDSRRDDVGEVERHTCACRLAAYLNVA